MATAADLTLFHRPSCGYCWRVIAVLRKLGLEIELRDTGRDREALAELVAHTGRSTVPVLRIRTADGAHRYMPESADIIDFLRNEV